MSKVKRVRNCNALIELICMAKTERGKKLYKAQLVNQLVNAKNDPLG